MTEVPAHKKVWFDEQVMANIMSWKEAHDHPDHKQGHDHEKDHFHVCHVPTEKTTVFNEQNGYCVCGLPKPELTQKLASASYQDVVEEQMKCHASQWMDEARQALASLKSTGLQSW